jgi:hypothetical protein
VNFVDNRSMPRTVICHTSGTLFRRTMNVSCRALAFEFMGTIWFETLKSGPCDVSRVLNAAFIRVLPFFPFGLTILLICCFVFDYGY